MPLIDDCIGNNKANVNDDRSINYENEVPLKVWCAQGKGLHKHEQKRDWKYNWYHDNEIPTESKLKAAEEQETKCKKNEQTEIYYHCEEYSTNNSEGKQGYYEHEVDQK